MVTTCPHYALDSIGVTAGYYSTASGVMAGFAFVALFPLITDRKRLLGGSVRRQHAPASDLASDAGTALSGTDAPRDMGTAATEALCVGFIALLLSAISYAVLAGDTVPGGRAASAEIVAGAALATSALQLVYAIALLVSVEALEVDRQLRRFFQRLGAALCPVAYLLLILGLDDYRDVRKMNGGSATVFGVGWALFIPILGTVGLALVASREQLADEAPRAGSREALPALANPSYCALGMALLGVVATALVESRGVCHALSEPVIVIVMVVACAALLNQSLAFLAPQEPYRFGADRRRSGQSDAAKGGLPEE